MSCCGRIANCVSCLQSLFGNNNPNQRELNNQNEIEMELKTPPGGGVCVFLSVILIFVNGPSLDSKREGNSNRETSFYKIILLPCSGLL